MPNKSRVQRRTASTPRPGAAVPAPAARKPTRPDWHWRTFPVFAAFSAGLLVAFLSNEGTVNPVAFALLIAALLGVGYSLAHLVVTNIVVAGRLRRREHDDDTEDVVVHPDET
jgi:hypothetical protein